nr:ATP synthase F0 subunit 8 [Eurhadina rubra]
MPQMAPMWWTFLMMTFLLSMFLCMNMLYFNYNKMFMNNFKKKNNNLIWKW